MRKLLLVASWCLGLSSATMVPAQEAKREEAVAAPATEGADNAVNARMSRLEAELGKVRDTSPEAADIMLELVDLYHANARVFGLIRVGQNFVNLHPAHAKHGEVMLKLIDALVATSRNKETTAMCRQFLQRRPDSDQCPRLETVLADALEQVPDLAGAAAAHEVVWRRQGNNPTGRDAVVRAIAIGVALNTKDTLSRAATLCEALLEQLPAGDYAGEAGYDAVQYWYRAAEYAKSNTAGNKLVAKGSLSDPKQLAAVHSTMAQSYANLGQWTNAAESLRKARTLADSPELHGRLIVALHSSACTPGELAPVVDEYMQKYPTRGDRFSYRSYLPLAYVRGNDAARALTIIAELLPFEAAANDMTGVFIRTNGSEPAKLAETESVLLAALAKNPAQAAYLRYQLALTLYRDLMKDLNKARQVARELVALSPSPDGYTVGPMSWLLYNEPNEQEFQADVERLLKARADNVQWPAHRAFLPGWCKEASANAEHKSRAAWAQAKVDFQDQEALFKDWVAGESADMPTARAARSRLMVPAREAALNDQQALALFQAQGYSYRYYGPAEDRAVAVDVYSRMAARFPKDFQAAVTWMEVTFDYGTPEAAKAAAVHLLSFEPPSNLPDAWRRTIGAADRAADAALVKQAYQWIEGSQAKYGFDPVYASIIGDVLDKHGMKAEATAYWRRAVPLNRDYAESRTCAERVASRLEGVERTAYLIDLLKTPCDFHGAYAMLLAADYLKSGDLDNFEKTLRASRALQDTRPLRNWGMEEYPPQTWVDQYRADAKADDEMKRRVFRVVREMRLGRPSASASLAFLELPLKKPLAPIRRLLAIQSTTTEVGDIYLDWDRLMVYGQAAMARKDYEAAAALLTGMLANIPNVDEARKQAGREMVGQSYARMGAAGFSIDESSPIAPLLQAALYLRLGDERLAYEAYNANRPLFDAHRNEVPVDLLRFVCESHIAAGGDENHERAEEILRGWLVKNSEVKEIDDSNKAAIQLLLAKNYFKAQRFDVARNEYTTVLNRWPMTPEAIEADFGIGESYMAQKVYDQAETVFEKLSGSLDREVVIRAEFLRGVLANRRGDRDEAREIFRGVLDRVPSVELANQALFNLAEVYGAEQRYMDQLELLRTVGRLGRTSQRWHAPGTALSIVVQDSDLGVSRGHGKIPVKVTTEPGGDEETIYLYSGGAGKGLFRADLETRLGQVTKHDKVLELTGKDTIKCDYPDEFKAEFRSVPLSDAEIKIASNAKFEVSSSKIIDEEKETFSERLEREAREEEARRHIAENRPKNQIKPGNLVYLRVHDPDRDLSDELDQVRVKLVASGGDEVQVALMENGPHTGVFEGTAPTGELPAGALASDTSIGHNPLMAIDQDPGTAWLSKPDGATPKWLSVDMKDLKFVDHVTISTPSGTRQAPRRGDIEGSNDGRFWFRLASQPPLAGVEPVAGEFGHMTQRVYAGNYAGYTEWSQVVALTKNAKPVEEREVDQLAWKKADESEQSKQAHAVLWQGKLVQPRAGAARFAVRGSVSALVLDGRLEMAIGPGNRAVDVWLEPGTHDLTIFAGMNTAAEGADVLWAREDHNAAQVVLAPLRPSDFDLGGDIDLNRAAAKPALVRQPATVKIDDGVWDFKFESIELRHVRLIVKEYVGEAVAVNQFVVRGDDEDEQFVPTSADVLSLAANDTLEIAGGDVVTAGYTDDLTQNASGQGQLLTSELTATYFNGGTNTISYDFIRQPNGQIITARKQLIRIDPGERFIVEVVDYDQDQTDKPDLVKIQVAVNDGEPLELTAQETMPYSGVFTKEVDTGAEPEQGKLTVKPGDRIYCAYHDAQNTFPGHAVARETIVYVTEPSHGRMRFVETRIVRPPQGTKEPPRFVFLPAGGKPNEKDVAHVAFEVPLTVEVYDPDAARDSASTVTVRLQTTDGAKIDVDCAVSSALSDVPDTYYYTGYPMRWALEEGRFVGQVILQLGSKHSPNVVPLSAGMPRDLIGSARTGDEKADKTPMGGEALITGVLNLTGKDIITATYADASRADGETRELVAKARLIANATLACTDRDYEKDVSRLHVGEKMFLVVTDADLDVSDERDVAGVEVTTQQGDEETVELEETLAHSGVFTGSVTLKPAEKPTPGNLSADDPVVETYFGDSVHLRFVDRAASTETGQLELDLELPVVVGTDGLVAAFSKSFDDETLAVETQFHVAESFFELFKSHKNLGRTDEQRSDLESGRRVLREVMEDYPNPKYVPRIAYLLGQFAQELKQWDEAIESYQLIVRQHADHALAADAQYKLAQCHEEAGDFEQALEAYVTLAATYPKSPLIANVMIRISEHFYRTESYKVAAQVGEKFLERFETHEWAPKMAFRIGQCYYKGKEYSQAGKSFDQFAKVFPDDQLCADALFWSGESFRMASNVPQAFRRYNRCRWDFPASEAAKYARGRLALPEMLQQFEAEANVDDE
ncbi:MAG TPA: tetratricopeptide repeat protein [Pirellulales bacterium]|nr:tetratricopeptide repeat protein [Pirellulales bacterium]